MAKGGLQAQRCPHCGNVMGMEGFTDRELHAGGRVVRFTKQEWTIVELLNKYFGQYIHQERIISVLYDDTREPQWPEEILRVVICKIRKKIRAVGLQIECAWGQGYRLMVENEADLRAQVGQDGGTAHLGQGEAKERG